jgi:hypothetical protein
MFHLPEIPVGPIEGIIAASVVVAWAAISAFQQIKAKLHEDRCVICNRIVSHRDQARNIPVACHERCRYLGSLLPN